MKYTLRQIAATGVWALMICAGCAAPRYSDTPYPQRFEANAQARLQAVGHWRIIAEHFAEQIDSDLTLQNIDAALYIPSDPDDFVFVESFRELLTTALSRRGRKIHAAPQDAQQDAHQGTLTVDIRYSVYKFNAEREQKIDYPGETTKNVLLLGTGVWVLAGSGASVAAIIPLAVLYDASKWLTRSLPRTGPDGELMRHVPRSEILVTSTVSNGENIVSRISNIYYVTDDEALYWRRPRHNYGQSKDLNVKGGD
jgi:hypothetical protein